MVDDGTCFRCGHMLGTNAACWWCEWYVRSMKQ